MMMMTKTYLLSFGEEKWYTYDINDDGNDDTGKIGILPNQTIMEILVSNGRS